MFETRLIILESVGFWRTHSAAAALDILHRKPGARRGSDDSGPSTSTVRGADAEHFQTDWTAYWSHRPSALQYTAWREALLRFRFRPIPHDKKLDIHGSQVSATFDLRRIPIAEMVAARAAC